MALTKNQKAKRALSRILSNESHPVVVKAMENLSKIGDKLKACDQTLINKDHAQTTTFCARHAVDMGAYRDGFLGLTEFEADQQRLESLANIPKDKPYSLEYEQKINKQRHDKRVTARRTHAMTGTPRMGASKVSRINSKESRVVHVPSIQR